MNIGAARHPARGNDRDGDCLGQSACRRMVHTLLGPVAADIRIDDFTHPLVLTAQRQVRGLQVGRFRPALDSHPTGPGVNADRNPAGEPGAGFRHKSRLTMGDRSQDGATDTESEQAFERGQAADTAPDLDRNAQGLTDALNRGIDRGG